MKKTLFLLPIVLAACTMNMNQPLVGGDLTGVQVIQESPSSSPSNLPEATPLAVAVKNQEIETTPSPAPSLKGDEIELESFVIKSPNTGHTGFNAFYTNKSPYWIKCSVIAEYKGRFELVNQIVETQTIKLTLKPFHKHANVSSHSDWYSTDVSIKLTDFSIATPPPEY